MDIKRTYSYFILDNLKTTAIIYLIVVAVGFVVYTLFSLLGFGGIKLSELIGLIPNYFTVFIVSFIFTIVGSRSGDLICNQFGRSRITAFVVNVLVLLSISIVVAFAFSTLLSIFYKIKLNEYIAIQSDVQNFYIQSVRIYLHNGAKYTSRLAFWLYNFVYYIYISMIAVALGVFNYSLWVRLEKRFRWIAFILVPIILAYSIPRFLIAYFSHNPNWINLIEKLVRFFGLENGFSYQFVLVSTLVFIIPLLVISFFIMKKKPLYGRKK